MRRSARLTSFTREASVILLETKRGAFCFGWMQGFECKVVADRTRPIGEYGVLRVNLLGGVGFSFNGRDIVLPNRKARAAIAVIALSDRKEYPRDRLTGLFWSESDQSHANAALRQALHEARTAFAAVGCDWLQPNRLTIGLGGGPIEIDILEILAGIEHEHAPPDSARPVVTSSLFAGFDDLDDAFEEWVNTFRDSIRSRHLRALETAFRDPRTPKTARRMLADLALAQDPTHEEACRTAMRCAAEDGEVAAAIRYYDNLYRLLDSDFDMEPSVATQAMVADIKQGKFDPQPSAPSPQETERHRVDPVPRGPPWVAVLPFRTIGDATHASVVADGIVDDIARMLAGLRELVVISTNSTMGYRGRAVDPRVIERDLGVRYAVSGSVRMARDTIRISAELAETSTGAVQWAHAYDCADGMLLDTQDRIVEEISNRIAPSIQDAELRRLRVHRSSDLGAYHLTLKARDLSFQLERDAFDEAGMLINQAIALEPNYSGAHLALAGWYSLRLGQGWSDRPAEDIRKLNRATAAAVRLDGSNARALALAGHCKTIYEHSHAEGLALTAAAIDLAPNDAEAWLWSSPTRSYHGDAIEGLSRAERALRLSPRDPFLFRTYHFLCIAHYARDAHDEASHWGLLSYRENPHYTSNIRLTAASLIALGRTQEARALAEQVLRVEPDFRANSMLEKFPFRDRERRAAYVRQLLAAGLPA